jgi:hypothetical protein
MRLTKGAANDTLYLEACIAHHVENMLVLFLLMLLMLQHHTERMRLIVGSRFAPSCKMPLVLAREI